MADSFDQRFVIPASFLVAFCGGVHSHDSKYKGRSKKIWLSLSIRSTVMVLLNVNDQPIS